MQGFSRKFGRPAAALLLAMALGACAPVIRNHGYVPPQDDLAEVLPGIDTRGSVEETIGAPGTSGVLEAGDWYYIGSRIRHFGWRAPEEVKREVVAVSFGPDDIVENIERFGLEDGRVVTLSRRVTDTKVQNITFIRQLLRNFGRVNLEDAL